MLSFLYHDSSFPSDLNTLLESTMKMCIRPDNDSDNTINKENKQQIAIFEGGAI